MTRPDHLTIYLSGRCNLSCPYCYARGVSAGAIQPAALRRALAAFAAACPEDPKFTILGGEPLLERPLLRLALSEIRRLFGAAAPVHLFTNGLLLKKGEVPALLRRGVKLTVSFDGGRGPGAVAGLPRPLRGRVSAGYVVSPATAGRLLPDLLSLLEAGFDSLAWSPDITASWGTAALERLRSSARALLLEYLRRLKLGRGIWELANGYEAVALADRGERPGHCRNLALAPDGFFYPCDKMLAAAPERLRPFRAGADGAGREKFFALARSAGVGNSQSMCPAAPWAAARFASRPRRTPAGQAEARRAAAGWLAAAAKAGLSSPAFRRLHGI